MNSARFLQAAIHDAAHGRHVDPCAALPRILVTSTVAVMALRPI